MKRITILFATLLAAIAGSATAQNLTAFKQHLATPVQADSLTTVHAVVRVAEHGTAADTVRRAEGSERKNVSGYRIVIFMSNAPPARAEAVAARESFDALYPDEPSHMVYDNPYFKVAVGNCTTQEEAIMLMERVRSNFPKAFLMRDNIAVGEFVKH